MKARRSARRKKKPAAKRRVTAKRKKPRKRARAAGVDRTKVKPKVLRAIKAEAKRNILKLMAGDEKLKLEKDLKIGASRRGALAQPYNKISDGFGGLPIGPKSSRAATTVKKAIDLVHARSNRKWS